MTTMTVVGSTAMLGNLQMVAPHMGRLEREFSTRIMVKVPSKLIGTKDDRFNEHLYEVVREIIHRLSRQDVAGDMIN